MKDETANKDECGICYHKPSWQTKCVQCGGYFCKNCIQEWYEICESCPNDCLKPTFSDKNGNTVTFNFVPKVQHLFVTKDVIEPTRSANKPQAMPQGQVDESKKKKSEFGWI